MNANSPSLSLIAVDPNDARAQALYAAAGYQRIDAYGPYVGDPFNVCFEKAL